MNHRSFGRVERHRVNQLLSKIAFETLESRQMLSVAPSDLDAFILSPNQIGVSWADNASDETAQKIERKEGTSGTWQTVATPAANVTSWIDSSVTASTQYTYRARATDSSGDSAPSNEDSVVAPVVLSPTADAYARNGSYASTNYGSATLGYTRYAYLKFDLSSLSSVATAKVRIYGSTGSAGTNELAIYPLTISDWSESTLNWNNKPGEHAITLDTVTTHNTAQWHEFDVSAYVQNEKSAGRNTIGFVIKSLSAEASGFDIRSREHASNGAQLLVAAAADAVPNAPSGLALDAVSDTKVDLAWTDNSDNETGVIGWKARGSVPNC